MLHALLGEDGTLEPLKRVLVTRTEGNPFFLEESVRTLVETGVLLGERGSYRLARPLPAIQVPATVQAVLAARIDRLPPGDKAMLQMASVVGTDIPEQRPRSARPIGRRRPISSRRSTRSGISPSIRSGRSGRSTSTSTPATTC